MTDEQDRFKFSNEVGYEAYQHIVKRVQALGPLSFMDVFTVVVGAATVCLANALRPGVEAAARRDVAADQLANSAIKQVRSFLEPVVRGK